MNWKPTAYILAVEHRTCSTCRTTYIAPAHETRVELTRNTGGSLRINGLSSYTISLNEFADRLSMVALYAAFLPVLPRRIEDVHISVPSCPACFHEHSNLQIDFWPRPGPPSMSTSPAFWG